MKPTSFIVCPRCEADLSQVDFEIDEVRVLSDERALFFVSFSCWRCTWFHAKEVELEDIKEIFGDAVADPTETSKLILKLKQDNQWKGLK